MNVCTIYIYTYVCRLIVAEISVQIDKNEAIQESKLPYILETTILETEFCYFQNRY